MCAEYNGPRMSMIVSSSRPSTNNTIATTSLDIALAEFAAILTDDERKQLQEIKGVPDSSAALVFTARLDESNQTRRGRSIGARAYSMLQSVQQFSAVINTFVSSHPEIAAFVWGSVKLTVLIATNITSYFESLADLFMGLNKLFPKFDEYQLLFPSSPALRESICKFHASVIQLCKQSILLIRQPWIRKVTTDLRSQLGPQIENIQSYAKDVKDDIALAKATFDRKEQEFQEQERKLAAKHRKYMSIFASQSLKESENARERQIRRDQDLLRERNKNLLDALSSYAHQKNFIQTRKKRHVNTTTWLFSTPEFIRWKFENLSSVFLLTGKLGSGKTVLTSSVVEHLWCEKTRQDELTAFLFPRFDDSVSLSAVTVLRSIIRQSLMTIGITGEVEKQLSRLDTHYAEMDAIETLLTQCVSKLSRLYIVIDALDEFEKAERRTLLRSLSFMTSLSDSKVKLFLVGRSSVADEIRKMFPVSQERSADCYEAQNDIETYIREIVTSKQGEELIVGNPVLAQEVIKALIEGANGMFLWVDYQIEEIYKCTCDDDIRAALMTLPKSLGEIFDRAAKRITKNGSVKIASQIFRWVAAAKRPLTLDEIGEALSYEPGQPYSIAGKKPNGLERITAWCENLVQLDEELHIVQFTHRSVLQHFLEQPSDSSLQTFYINMKEADHFIGEICVTYLDSNDFKTALIKKPVGLPSQLPNYIESVVEDDSVTSRVIHVAQRLNAPIYNIKSTSGKKGMILIKDSLTDSTATLQLGHPFLEYASEYWLPHTRNFDEGKSETWNLWRKMIRGSHDVARTPWTPEEFLDSAPVVYDWLGKHAHLAITLQVASLARPNPPEVTRLICRFVALGCVSLNDFVLHLVQYKEELSNGLIWAAGGGHLKIVQKLLDAQADVNTNSRLGGTALCAAARGGHLEVVRELLDAQADVNATSELGETALYIAAKGGRLEVVQKLLDAQADVNACSRDGGTALCVAARGGHLEVIQALLDSNADVNAGRKTGKTALRAAANMNRQEVIALLKSYGARK